MIITWGCWVLCSPDLPWVSAQSEFVSRQEERFVGEHGREKKCYHALEWRRHLEKEIFIFNERKISLFLDEKFIFKEYPRDRRN
jgi:hypothetical protein